MESIFVYSDYRQYLTDYYLEKKKANGGFSLKVLSDKAGFKARDYVLRVMKGARNLSTSGIFMLSKALHLSEKETIYFEHLVGFNQAKTVAEKEHHFQMMNRCGQPRATPALREEQYEYLSQWYHSALRSLLPVSHCTEPAQVAKLLEFPVPLREVKRSIDLMMKLGLLEQDQHTGSYRTAASMLSSGEEIRTVALAEFHRQILSLARIAMDTFPSVERDFSGITMSISPTALEKIKSELKEFRKKIMNIAHEDSNEDRVYQMEINLFPLTKRFRRKGTGQTP